GRRQLVPVLREDGILHSVARRRSGLMNTRIAPRRGGNAITWEQQYLDYLLVANKLRSGALQELERCADRAFDVLSPSAVPPDLVAGAIVGAVQSGKTGLMIKLA